MRLTIDLLAFVSVAPLGGLFEGDGVDLPVSLGQTVTVGEQGLPLLGPRLGHHPTRQVLVKVM